MLSVSDTRIEVPMPQHATSGPVRVVKPGTGMKKATIRVEQPDKTIVRWLDQADRY
ncbi:MAG TPA: hypothetical protein VK040_02935 [Balneolaceae bacterium]|nr:hypothetical protein [Balneolaceae bacterium]